MTPAAIPDDRKRCTCGHHLENHNWPNGIVCRFCDCKEFTSVSPTPAAIPEPQMNDVLPDLEYLYAEAEKSYRHEVTDPPNSRMPGWIHHDSFHRDAERNMQAVIRRCHNAEQQVQQLRQNKVLYDHATKCVDRVFQKCSENPEPLLPDFMGLGEDKFKGVILLAQEYIKVKQHRARLIEALQHMLAAHYNPRCKQCWDAETYFKNLTSEIA